MNNAEIAVEEIVNLPEQSESELSVCELDMVGGGQSLSVLG
jgi:hypothetical protein